MSKQHLLLGVLILLIGCAQNKTKRQELRLAEELRLYSNIIADSFSISISLPNGYKSEESERYPVVYLLDANLYFDIMATIVKKYGEVGLVPNVILVGIGYKDFPTMDSLRNRDDTYPVAIAEYEMSTSGGADKFLAFIDKELIPFIDKKYITDTLNRSLMGHSLGGYFTCYALLQNILGKSNLLSNYIAASPSLHYNHYYLLNKFKETSNLPIKGKNVKAYLSYGGLEDEDNIKDSSMLTFEKLSNKLNEVLYNRKPIAINYKCDVFSNLSHMDTQFPTFIKGLQWTLAK